MGPGVGRAVYDPFAPCGTRGVAWKGGEQAWAGPCTSHRPLLGPALLPLTAGYSIHMCTPHTRGYTWLYVVICGYMWLYVLYVAAMRWR